MEKHTNRDILQTELLKQRDMDGVVRGRRMFSTVLNDPRFKMHPKVQMQINRDQFISGGGAVTRPVKTFTAETQKLYADMRLQERAEEEKFETE